MRAASPTRRAVLANLADAINRRRGADWEVVRRLGGWSDGAWLLRDAHARRAVLKTGDEHFARGLRRVAPIVKRARLAGWPTPAWLAWGVHKGVAFQLQEYAPGSRLLERDLTTAVVDEILRINDIQAGLGPTPDGPSWSRWTRAVLFENAAGWSSALKVHSGETASLLRTVNDLVGPLGATRLPETDLVHGDFNLANLVVSRGRVTVVDVNAAAAGPRGYDLARFALAALIVPRPPDQDLVTRIVEHARSVSEASVWRMCLCLQAVEWAGFGTAHWPDQDTRLFARSAQTFLRDFA
jgi:aminoglycoside phosphotransferase (APT) family kinase protein